MDNLQHSRDTQPSESAQLPTSPLNAILQQAASGYEPRSVKIPDDQNVRKLPQKARETEQELINGAAHRFSEEVFARGTKSADCNSGSCKPISLLELNPRKYPSGFVGTAIKFEVNSLGDRKPISVGPDSPVVVVPEIDRDLLDKLIAANMKDIVTSRSSAEKSFDVKLNLGDKVMDGKLRIDMIQGRD